MAPHSSALAWKIPWMEEPGGLQSMGSLRFGDDWAISLSLFTFMHWRKKWQPTPLFLPGESQGRGSLVGCLLWGWQRRTRPKRLSSSSSSSNNNQMKSWQCLVFPLLLVSYKITVSFWKKKIFFLKCILIMSIIKL